jgi:hypothetical protein
MSKIFEPIEVGGGLSVMAGGGLVDVFQKPYRQKAERRLCISPSFARKLAAAMIVAADAAEGKPDGFKAQES